MKPSKSPFYDNDFVARKPRAATGDEKNTKASTRFKHGLGGYKNHKCRCDTCRQGWREWSRQNRGAIPSKLASEVVRLSAELDAAEAHIDALREENAMLRARLQDLEWAAT